MFDEIPLEKPATPLLDSIDHPADLRKLHESQLTELATQLRAFLLFSVGRTGGHFGAGLGVVELTIALHYALNTPEDRLIWDVGHQSYPHKILTGRRDAMRTIRQLGGLSGFPKREESPFDTFGVGHSSTSISAALGIDLSNNASGSKRNTVAVIGDGALTGGMAFEALNHASHTNTDMLVILNDNNMAISKSVGGLADYFSQSLGHKNSIKPHAGSEEQLKLPPGALFGELGFHYQGPIDGHDVKQLLRNIRQLLKRPGPKLLHIITSKGKGFAPAELDPVGYHALTKIEPKNEIAPVGKAQPKNIKYQSVFGQWLCDMAAQDSALVAITPAMREGSGMVEFAKRFPERFHDVAIAEQHAVTFAAGLACEKRKPLVAIYSTFLQRAYDQLIHDVALQNLDVTFAIDRAGLVGEDGPSHAGSFDISFLRCIPNLILATPSDENECRQLLFSAYHHKGPAAVRYPRGRGTGVKLEQQDQHLPVGKGRVLRQGKNICILNFGVLLPQALKLAENLNFSVCDMRWAKPLDRALIFEQASKHSAFVSLEENAIAGGAGSAVMELLAKAAIAKPVLPIGLQDCYYQQGKRQELISQAGLDERGIARSVRQWLDQLEADGYQGYLSLR